VKSTIPSLEGLDRLAFREGVDIRPTLARVLTDLYVQKPVHTAEEEHHYTELVLRLIDVVDISTRAIVAKKLAVYAPAPAAVVRRLARDVLEVAEPVLKHSQSLPGAELLAVIQDFGPRYAAVIADRRRPSVFPPAPDSPARHLVVKHFERLQPSEDHLVTTPPATNVAEHEADEMPVEQPAIATTADLRLGELFFAASSSERRAILTNLDRDAEAPAPSQPNTEARTPSSATVGRLEAAALGQRPEEFIGELENALGVTNGLARRIVGDEAGEPLLVAMKALAMPPEVLLRVILFLDPAVGQSVPRVFDLAKFYDRITQDAATRIVASLRDVALANRRMPAHQPLLWNDEADRGRRAAADAARRPAGITPALRRETPTALGRRHGTT
jgi:uncharacterized protein (DUF2336 family)